MRIAVKKIDRYLSYSSDYYSVPTVDPPTCLANTAKGFSSYHKDNPSLGNTIYSDWLDYIHSADIMVR